MSQLRVCMFSIIYSVNLLQLPGSWFVQAFSLAKTVFVFLWRHWISVLFLQHEIVTCPLRTQANSLLLFVASTIRISNFDVAWTNEVTYWWRHLLSGLLPIQVMSPSSLHCMTTNSHYSKPYMDHYSQPNTTTDNKGRLLSKVQLQWQNEYQEWKVACNSGRILRSSHTLYSFFLHRFCMRNRFKISSWVFKMFDESLQSFSLILIFEIFIPEEPRCKHLTYTETQEVLHSTWPAI